MHAIGPENSFLFLYHCKFIRIFVLGKLTELKIVEYWSEILRKYVKRYCSIISEVNVVIKPVKTGIISIQL